MTGLEVHLTPKKSVRVPDLPAASAAVRKHIDDGWIGSTAWHRYAKAGEVHQDGKHVATVSYNGRLWNPDGSELVA